MRGENFVSHLDGLGGTPVCRGTPVAHHCLRVFVETKIDKNSFSTNEMRFIINNRHVLCAIKSKPRRVGKFSPTSSITVGTKACSAKLVRTSRYMSRSSAGIKGRFSIQGLCVSYYLQHLLLLLSGNSSSEFPCSISL
jgi:hypothetical protein